MKKIALLSMMVLALLLTQCKKKEIAQTSGLIENVKIELTVTNIGDRTSFDGGAGTFDWSGTEYVHVSSSINGYLGEISGSGGSFSGNIDMPGSNCTVYFIYLGNGSKTISKYDGDTKLSFSDQSDANVTDYHIAILPVDYKAGTTEFSGDLTTKIAIARIDFSKFGSEEITMSGSSVYNTATINFKTGAVTGTKGDVNLGNKGSSAKYVALIPQPTASATTIQFNSATHTGSLDFVNGIKENKYYCKVISTSPQTLGSLVPDVSNLRAFTINSSGDQVYFSHSNLRYNLTTNEWSFSAHQYDYLGKTQGTSGGQVDLFSWGQTTEITNHTKFKYKDATLTVPNANDPEGGEWGVAANSIDAYTWRTLTQSEWDYVLKQRSGTRYAKATINDVTGVIILPDGWTKSVNAPNDGTASYNVNVISKEKWESDYETLGAVFLPSAGFRQGSVGVSSHYQMTFSTGNNAGRYWTAKHKTGHKYAHHFQFSNTKISIGDDIYTSRDEGCAVRLVRDITTK